MEFIELQHVVKVREEVRVRAKLALDRIFAVT
jgi:hypothetical protein